MENKKTVIGDEMMGVVTSKDAAQTRFKTEKTNRANRWNAHKLLAEIVLGRYKEVILEKEIDNLDEAAGLLYDTVSNQIEAKARGRVIGSCMTFNTELRLSPINGNSFLSMSLDPYGNVCVVEKGWILVPYSEWRNSDKAECFQYYIS